MTVAEHLHTWHPFPAGRGCGSCEAWEFWPKPSDHLIDALPTSLLEQPPKPVYVPPVREDDLVLEVMNDLMSAIAEPPSWLALEKLAVLIIDRVRNAPVA